MFWKKEIKQLAGRALCKDASRKNVKSHLFARVIFAKPLNFSRFQPMSRRSLERQGERTTNGLDEDEQKFITSVISEHSDFVLSNLAPPEVKMLVESMERFEPSLGDHFIEQGSVGDYLYVIKEGSIKYLKDGVEVGTVGPGTVFGELSLLYDCPRAVTVVATSDDCLLFKASRETFRSIQVSFILSDGEETRRLLKGTKLFADLPDYTIREMASYLFKKTFVKGEILCQKGEDIEEVYFIKEGRVIAKDIEMNMVYLNDITFNPGDCFGERAIVMGDKCIGTVECLTDGVAYVLTRERFLHCLQGMDMHAMILNDLDVKVLQASPIIGDSDLSRLEILELVKKLTTVTFEPGEVVSTVGDMMECALYFTETKNKDSGGIECTTIDGVSKLLKPSEPFGFGLGALKLVNYDDIEAAAIKGKERNLKHLESVEAILETKRNLVEYNRVAAWATFKAVGNETVHLRKLAMKDAVEVIYDPLRLGRNYKKNQSDNANITHVTLEKGRLLGQGTFGQVWLCRDPSKNCAYALKVQYKRQLITNHQSAGVVRETNIMRKMHHPFVMGLVHAEQDPACLYMVMELAQGGELLRQMRNSERPNLSEPAAKFYAACMLEGLSYMHRRNYVYRDLKGENVLLDKDGYCVIVDLGFAKHVPDKTFTFCGTPIFIAPEVLLNKGHDKSADIWAFGVMIYEMLFGTNPFFDYNDPSICQRTLFKRIVRADFQRPCEQSAVDAYSKTSKEAKDLIKKLLVVNPNRRLGCQAQADLDIRNHPWFKEDIDFGKLYRKELEAPWVPEISDPFDGNNFKAIQAQDRTSSVDLFDHEQEKFKDFC